MVRETHNLATNFFFCVERNGQRAAKVPISVRWSKLELNWHKLNTNGSSVGNSGKAGGGGLIQNQEGGWVKGFSRAIGISSSVDAELWALRYGLRICCSMGLQALEIEIDSKVVADWAVGSTSINTAHSMLISNYKYLMEQLPRVKFKHYFKEANQYANFLAKKGAAQEQHFRIYDDPLGDMSMFLYYDSIGMYF